MNREHYIKSAIQSDDIDLKIQVIDSLIEYKLIDSDCINFLIEGLQSSERGVRDVSCRAVLTLDDKDKDYACKLISRLIIPNDISIRNLAGEILIKMGDFSTSHLIPYLNHEDPDVRKFACDILGIVSNEIALLPISNLLNDIDSNCLNSSIEAIGNIFERIENSFVSTDIIIKKLFEIFEKGSEDVKPNIIDTLGKIGGTEAEKFLMDIVKNNSDIFLKTAAIDSLAVTCNDISISTMLMNEIESYPEEIQSTLLKTIYAICFRTEIMLELPLSKRHIAHNALFDPDPDTRASAIVALGDFYIIDDVEGLLNAFNNGTNDIQIHILNHLFAESSSDIVDKFVSKYLNSLISEDSFESEIELLSYIAEVWDNSKENNKYVFMERVLIFGIENMKGRDSELLEFLSKLDKSIFNSKIEEISNKNEDFKNYFTNLA